MFEELVQATYRGEVNAWICWHANRLSRNPIDAGRIVHLMDEGVLDHIRTRERVYTNCPQDKLMIQIEFGLSKNDSEEKSRLVRSGIKRRHERGYPTGFPPVGFIMAGGLGSSGGSGSSFWEVDKKQFEILRMVFQRFLMGKDSLYTISEFARDKGLRCPKRRKLGGQAPSRAHIHRILSNTVYAGYFMGRNGLRYELADELPRLITEDELERIRLILGDHNPAKLRKQRRPSFGGLIKTPNGELLGADHKFHLVCDCLHKFCYLQRDRCPSCLTQIDRLQSPRYRSYIYYYSLASRRRLVRPIRSIEERKLRALTADHIRRQLRFPKGTREWALKYLHELQDEALRNRRREAEEQARFNRTLETKRKRLRELYLDELITKKDYRIEARNLQMLGSVKNAPDFTLSVNWKDEAQHMLELTDELQLLVLRGSASEVNQGLSSLGLTLIWDGETLSFKHSTKLRRLIALIHQAQERKREFKRPLRRARILSEPRKARIDVTDEDFPSRRAP